MSKSADCHHVLCVKIKYLHLVLCTFVHFVKILFKNSQTAKKKWKVVWMKGCVDERLCGWKVVWMKELMIQCFRFVILFILILIYFSHILSVFLF